MSYSRTLPLISALLLSTIASRAWAADMDAASRIDAVTVYPDAAAVTRLVDVDLPDGATTLIFKGLPMGVDPASLRVEGEANGALSIGSVETRVATLDAPVPDTATEAKLKTLRGEREAVQTALTAMQTKKAMMVRFSQVGPEKLVAEDKPVDVAQWNAAWDAVGAGLAKVGEDIRAAETRTRDIDEQIRALETARARPVARLTARDASVALEAKGAVKARILLTYRIAGANWRPLYDARLETAAAGKKPSLELVRRAAVSQRTGEDWSGVTLLVSTTRASRGTAAPEMLTQRLDFYEAVTPMPARPRAAQAPAAAGGLARDELFEKRKLDSAATTEPPPPATPAEEKEATLDSGAYQASFRIPGRIDVPNDGAQKTFRIGSRALSPELSVKAVPALDDTAYLSAAFINEEEAALLPGQVAIHRDGVYVGLGTIGLTAPGDTVDLGFGADERVKVTRVPVRRKENEPTWLSSAKTEAREFNTVIRNLHDFPVKATVIDQIPISENSAIVIEQLAATTPPTDKSVAGKRGVMAWIYDLKPSESREIRLSYRMKWPADREVVFQRVSALR